MRCVLITAWKASWRCTPSGPEHYAPQGLQAIGLDAVHTGDANTGLPPRGYQWSGGVLDGKLDASENVDVLRWHAVHRSQRQWRAGISKQHGFRRRPDSNPTNAQKTLKNAVYFSAKAESALVGRKTAVYIQDLSGHD